MANYWTTLYNALIGKGYAKEINKPKEENRGASWASVGGVRPTFSQGDSLHAYGIHAYTHAAVKRASQDLSALPLKLIKGYGEEARELLEHPVIELLQNPSTQVDEFLFREQITTDLILCGNCYILLLGSSSLPVSIVRLHPDEIRIVTDTNEGIIGYEHSSSGSVVVYPPERIIHGRNASYAKGPQQIYGTGAIEALAKEITADLNAQKLASDASSKGRPDVLLSPKEDGDIWPEETRRQILDQYMGLAKQGGALVLSGQVEVSELQLSPREMEFQASRTFARESISALIGVPPSVLGLPTANYALGRQQAIEYWSNQIKRGKRIALLFTKIAKLWEDDLHFEHDYSDVEALQSVRDSKLLRIEKHIFNGVLPEIAYAYEGLDFPRRKEARDVGSEEEDNTRYISSLAKFIENKDIDYGLKSNASKAMKALKESTQQALKNKGKEHNEEHGKTKSKKLTNVNYLAVSYHRGLAAFNTNPSSVRPTVSTSSQWAMARVNSFLFALRNQRFRSGKHDTDLLPTEHPLSNAEKAFKEKIFKSEVLQLEVVDIPSNPKELPESDIEKSLLGSPPNWERYKSAYLLFNPDQQQLKSGYQLRIGRRLNRDNLLEAASDKGDVAIFKDLLSVAIDTLNGRYGRPPFTEEERRKAYSNIQIYYNQINEEAPPLLESYLSFNEVEKDEEGSITNFPKKGDDKAVSLSNSQWKVFDPKYAENLKLNYPEIWRTGGNIRGNDQYKKLRPITQRRSKKPQNLSEERAIRLREAWVARHEQDGKQFNDSSHPINLSTIKGLVAQIKWYAVSEIGERKMKKVLNEMKRKINEEKKKEKKLTKMWNEFIKNTHSKIERELEQAYKTYFKQAKTRYIERIKEHVTTDKGFFISEEKGMIVAREQLLSVLEEARIQSEDIFDLWFKHWSLTGSQELDKVYKLAKKEKPLDLVFGYRDLGRELFNDNALKVSRSTANIVMNYVQKGLEEGLAVEDIASLLKSDTSLGFDSKRALRISRTETTRIVSEATNKSYELAASDGINVKKQWLSARDNKVRPSHEKLDGTIVDINQNFVLSSTFGSYEASSPGNFSTVGENVNCRCTIIPVIED